MVFVTVSVVLNNSKVPPLTCSVSLANCASQLTRTREGPIAQREKRYKNKIHEESKKEKKKTTATMRYICTESEEEEKQ